MKMIESTIPSVGLALCATFGAASAFSTSSSRQDASVLDLATVSWTVESGNVSVPARIPSQVHLDLLAAGVIQEPTYGDNDCQQQWIANGNFTYTSAKLLNLSKSCDVDTHLIFDGLNTFADISFCGSHIASSDNEFRQWSFDIGKQLQNCTSDPSIKVAFKSSVPISTELAANAYKTDGSCIECFGTKFQFAGRQFIRQQQNDYGWDWGPGFAPQGIWLPARIVQTPKKVGKVSVQSLYVDIFKQGQVNNLPPDQSAPWVLNISTDYLGALPKGSGMQVNISDASGAMLEKISVNDLDFEPGRVTGSAILKSKPDLWWPAGHGSQALYNLTVHLVTNSSNGPVATTQKRIGFRTIVLNQTPITPSQQAQGIAPGANWHFEVNGYEIFAKGSNLVPPDPFWPRVTKEYAETLFSSAIAANHNMLRVWSSNVYLPDFMYDLADEYGLLLWSELQFSDAFYPNDVESVDNYVQEVSQQIRRINSHPSLALWCGGNELEAALQLVQIGMPLRYPAALSNFESLFLDALLRAVFDNTRSITYMASSTSLGYESFDYNRSRPIKERYSSIGLGTVYGDSDKYNYDVTQAFKLSTYPVSRFSDEFGFHSHSSYETYSAFMPTDQLSFNSSTLIHRNRNYIPGIADLASSTGDPNADPGNTTTKSLKGLGVMSQGATLYYPTPNKQDAAANFSMQIYATQIFQAEFVRSQIDFYRRGSGLRQRTLGSLYWQLNDNWAAPTWAGLEVGGRWKLLHHVAGDAYSPVVVAPFVDDILDGFSVSVTSDLWQNITGTASLHWYDWSGKEIVAGNGSSNNNSDNSGWTWSGKPFTVSAIHSTQIWSNNLLFLPSQLKTAVGVLRVDATTNGTAGKQQYTAQRFFVPQHLSEPSSIKAFHDPKLCVSYDAAKDEFTVTSAAVAAYVWLDHPLAAKGYFSENGFWMLPGRKTVAFKQYAGSSPPAGWQRNVTVRSVYDLTTP